MKTNTKNSASAMVLLEVVLATALFAMTAVATLAGLHSCFRALGNMQLESSAADLAISKVSEIQIGLIPPEDDGPNEYEEDETLADWTWEVITEEVEFTEELEGPLMLQVQVIITNVPSGYTYSTQFWMPEPPAVEEESPEVAKVAGRVSP